LPCSGNAAGELGRAPSAARRQVESFAAAHQPLDNGRATSVRALHRAATAIEECAGYGGGRRHGEGRIISTRLAAGMAASWRVAADCDPARAMGGTSPSLSGRPEVKLTRPSFASRARGNRPRRRRVNRLDLDLAAAPRSRKERRPFRGGLVRPLGPARSGCVGELEAMAPLRRAEAGLRRFGGSPPPPASRAPSFPSHPGARPRPPDSLRQAVRHLPRPFSPSAMMPCAPARRLASRARADRTIHCDAVPRRHCISAYSSVTCGV